MVAPATTVHHQRGPWPSLVLLLSPVHAAKCEPASGWEIDNEMMWIPVWNHLDMCGQPMTIKSGQPMTIKRAMHQASDGCHSAGFPPSKVCVSLKTLTASRFQASCLVLSKLSAPHGSHGMQFLMRQTRSCPTAWEGSSQASISSGSGNSNSTPCTSNPS